MSDPVVTGVSEFVPAVVERHRSDPGRLVQILREVQDAYGHIPDLAIHAISRGLWIPRARVEGVAQFYAFFSETPRGNYDIRLSDNITDHMLGKAEVMAYLCERLGVQPGITRADGRVSVDNTSCTGMCDQGPAALVNGYALTRLTRERIDLIVELVNHRVPVTEWPRTLFTVTDNVRRTDLLLEPDFEPGSALRKVLEQGAEATLEAVKRSGLRGYGGAGFRTAAKWAMCRDASADERFVVCNADEGEPGTFKDRVFLQSYTDTVLEGMTVCARVIGARRGYLYLRAEYRHMVEHLERCLQERREAGLLGDGILGDEDFSFDIEIHLGAGAYICGEESALIESLEGKRGVPRVRPPYPVTHGYRGKPTVVNNVQTFAAAAKIALLGGEWFAARGTDQSPGTVVLSISGDCARPGIYEFPFGVRISQVLSECGALDTQAVQVAGPAGHCVPESEFDRVIAFEDLATGGSFMVFNHQRDMLEVARNFAAFFAHESCGFCTPCRVGTSLMRNLVEKVCSGQGAPVDLDQMQRVARVLVNESHCGLGSTAANPVLDTLEKFPDAWQRRMTAAAFEPAFDLDGALDEARKLTGRDDKEAHL